MGLEFPGWWGGLVDVPGVLDGRAVGRLVSVLSGVWGEDQVAVRGSGVFGRRLVRGVLGGVSGEGSRGGSGSGDGVGGVGGWCPRGTVLVTGGTGALGGAVARWLAGRGVERFVLTSRRGLGAPGAVELRDELVGLGVVVDVVACDVADRGALAGVLGGISGDCPLTGVVHAAGVDRAVGLGEVGSVDVGEVWGAKVVGAVNLDVLTAGVELDAFVVFSSIAGVWGSAGQGVYSAANAFVDGLVEGRRGRGLVGTSVAWGPWAGGGMVVDSVEAEGYLRRRGLVSMDMGLAVGALGRAVDGGEVCVTVADVEWDRFGATFTSG
ncbi:beta-ketoacyl reductase, partial [Streptantibioticus silvisoli]|uniref:beta-ketoacyl reductase n=1 Tax=Streptantibioticus silvisoli TaxID=2705255 RepID=UPI003FD7EABF